MPTALVGMVLTPVAQLASLVAILVLGAILDNIVTDRTVRADRPAGRDARGLRVT
jgi:hypothetical protein